MPILVLSAAYHQAFKKRPGEHLNHTVVPPRGKVAEASSMEPQSKNSSCVHKPQVLVTGTADRQQGTLSTAIRAQQIKQGQWLLGSAV